MQGHFPTSFLHGLTVEENDVRGGGGGGRGAGGGRGGVSFSFVCGQRLIKNAIMEENFIEA